MVQIADLNSTLRCQMGRMAMTPQQLQACSARQVCRSWVQEERGLTTKEDLPAMATRLLSNNSAVGATITTRTRILTAMAASLVALLTVQASRSHLSKSFLAMLTDSCHPLSMPFQPRSMLQAASASHLSKTSPHRRKTWYQMDSCAIQIVTLAVACTLKIVKA